MIFHMENHSREKEYNIYMVTGREVLPGMLKVSNKWYRQKFAKGHKSRWSALYCHWKALECSCQRATNLCWATEKTKPKNNTHSCSAYTELIDDGQLCWKAVVRWADGKHTLSTVLIHLVCIHDLCNCPVLVPESGLLDSLLTKFI